jgi:hypothetical protein
MATLNQRTTLKRLVAAGNNKVYSEVAVAGTLTEVSGVTVDTTDNLNMFEGAQKAFVVNGTNLKIVDFANTKLTVTALTTAPTRGSTVTQLTSGATMVVDFVNTTKTEIYGFTTSGTFVTTAGYTLSGGGMDPETRVPSAVAEATTAPHGYNWTVYPGGTFGTMPTKAYLGCWYRGRAVLSGNPNDPHQWYMSRQLNPFDWLYASTDAQSAVAGNDADAGKVGDIVRALIPFHDDYLIFGCSNSFWFLQGDPTAGGSLQALSRDTGVFGSQSWCFDEFGNLYVAGTDGIYKLKRGELFLRNISLDPLPNLYEDEDVDPTTHRITLGYDKRRKGVVITITKISDATNSNYFYSVEGEGFFPESYPEECGAYSQFYYAANDNGYADLLVGCADGYIRIFDDAAKDDDIGATDEAISSQVLMPITDMNPENDEGQGRMTSLTLDGAGGASSGAFGDTDSITYDIHVADDAETLAENIADGATPLHTGSVTGPGRQKRVRVRARGKFLGVVLKNTTAASSWALEKISVITKVAGRVR